MRDTKWQFAFWIVTVFLVGGMTYLGNSVIANDRLREQGDKEIRQCLYDQLQAINSRLSNIEGMLKAK